MADRTPEERAQSAYAAQLARKFDALFDMRAVTHGTVIEAIGLLFAARSHDADAARKFAKDISVAIDVCFARKENSR